MNKCLIKGMSMFALGFAQEVYGCLVANNELRVMGAQMKICGKFQLTMGEAQSIIDRCIKEKNARSRETLKLRSNNVFLLVTRK